MINEFVPLVDNKPMIVVADTSHALNIERVRCLFRSLTTFANVGNVPGLRYPRSESCLQVFSECNSVFLAIDGGRCEQNLSIPTIRYIPNCLIAVHLTRRQPTNVDGDSGL